METKFLISHKFRKIGWILLIPSLVLGMLVLFDNFSLSILDGRMFTIYDSGAGPLTDDKQTLPWFRIIDVNFTQTIVGIFNIIVLLLIAFSKERVEDEFISKMRLEALVKATYVNYGLLIFCFIFFYNLDFLMVMIFNIFTILIFFIIFFNYSVYQSQRSAINEE